MEDIINYQAASRTLTGGSEGVRKNYSGKKHKKAVEELRIFNKYWTEKYGKK
jgi:hypothetical protein